MGLTLGISYSTTKNEQCTRCIPETVYKPFPLEMCKAAGKLILEIQALPKSCHVGSRPEGAYWWTDGQFMAPDDSCIYVTCGAFTPRSNTAWITASRIPVGRIMRVFLHNGRNPTGMIYQGSNMRNFPKIQPHPSGRYVGYIGCDAVKITTVEHEAVYNKSRDLRNSNHRFLAFSPDGRHLAVLQSAGRTFELFISSTCRPTAFNDDTVDLSLLMPGFKGGSYNEHLECKWSPDSQYIAVCSSIKFLFVLNKKLDLVVDVNEEILPEGVFPSWGGTFDYDPRYLNDVMAVGANNRCLYVVSLEKKAVVLETDSLSKDAIDCVLYSPSGDQIGVSLRDFKILLLDSCDGTVTFCIDIKEQCNSIENNMGFPSVMRLSFSCRGDQLVTSTCDGKVRVWQLPGPEISLFNLCKWKILSHVPASKLKLLPLPQTIKDLMISLPVS